ncbi:dihydropteroate synthase-like protein [Thermogladius sp. 4427co]|uniref:dihydropteroate synthase-like protein n=1 Tax=Thermogladius sp. 4427co TaxID=3450718 RepID=UPI003F796E85
MKILFVTGRLAENTLRNILSQIEGVGYDILVADIDIAAFITVDHLRSLLERHYGLLKEFELVVVPGFVRGDLSQLSRELGVKIVKGPRYAQDIPLFIKALKDGFEFSPQQPADELLGVYKASIEKELESKIKSLAWETSQFIIGSEGSSRPVSRFKPLIVAEITHGTEMDFEHLLSTARRFVEEGADIISIGGSIDSPRPRAIREYVPRLKSLLNTPIAIDVPDVSEVKAAIEAGADMIFASSKQVLEELIDLKAYDKPIVISRSVLPREKASINEFDTLIESLLSKGFRRIIVDPVLNPPITGLFESLLLYWEFKRRRRNIPVLMGVGNVTELIDADCHGVSAILAAIALEIGVELLLETEASDKKRGCISDLAKAVRLASMAYYEKKPPKDYPTTNLLYVKNKRSREPKVVLPERAVYVGRVEPQRLDPMGYFRVLVDRVGGYIVLEHYRYNSKEPDEVLYGRDPVSLGREAVARGLLSLLDHAVYLGVELGKAGIALKLGRDYIQDQDLF